MLEPAKVVDIDLTNSLPEFEGLERYASVLACVRLGGVPIGSVKVPVANGRCPKSVLAEMIVTQLGDPLIRGLLRQRLTEPLPQGRMDIEHLLEYIPPSAPECSLNVTVAVCTRDRAEKLAACLEALEELRYPALDLLVVDNAPSNDESERIVRTQFPRIRYVREDRPGLDWARNRAIVESHSQVIAFTDDDVVVDPDWIQAIVRIFIDNPGVMAVTGLVLPSELETEAQLLFEHYGGFGKGYVRRWHPLNRSKRIRDFSHIGAGVFGTGANMAFRRTVFEQIGGFDPALDVGTVTGGGGDLEMFFRVLQEGHGLVYEPSAVVWHRHRRGEGELRKQIRGWGTAVYAYLMRSLLAYPDARFAILSVGVRYFWKHYVRPLLSKRLSPPSAMRELRWLEFRGALTGVSSYARARLAASRIEKAFGRAPLTEGSAETGPRKHKSKEGFRRAVRVIDLSRPLPPLEDVTDYSSVAVFVVWQENLLGELVIANHYDVISVCRLSDAIVDRIGFKLLHVNSVRIPHFLPWEALRILKRRCGATDGTDVRRTLAPHVSVSIVVATYDRPEGLRRCLERLQRQQSPRCIEIIVVDNNPSSKLTPPVVAHFPQVILVREPRKGLAYARNAGINAGTGDIVVTTDDDVVMEPTWLEKLLAPFSRRDVMIVTGNVLPAELETSSQLFFETYGGLGRGYEPAEFDGEWFQSFVRRPVPTWKLGATANAAFRATIFSHPRIGLLNEVLGPGMPSGVGEDTYLFYRVLKEGHRIVYEPRAYVWHTHRREIRALRQQLYNYSKGHVAYHLTTFLADHDLRGIPHVLFHLPIWHLKRVIIRLARRGDYPLSLILVEILGNFAGPFALWRSHRRVKREGRSYPYVPVAERKTDRLRSHSYEGGVQ